MHLTMPASTLDVGEVVKEEAFAIGNMAVILELLRSKMYSNPIRTIIQEISSNARDANREAGKPSEPIYIKLPTKLEPELHIKDSGLGISPARMSGVYLQYGNSTKRDNDEETGRFGLGAKSPFAYTSTFGIETITEENGTHTKRDYVATIDQTRIGKVLLVGTKKTDQPCGTTIKVPIKPQDMEEFARWTNIMLGRWNPLPKLNLLAEDVFETPDTPDITGEDWELVLTRGQKGVFYYEDLIPYEVKKENFENIPDKLRTLFNHVRVNIFGKGKIEVTGNRESIDYQPHVQKYILDKLQSIYTEINQRLSERIKEMPNLWEALVIVHRYKEEFGTDLLKDVKWRDAVVPHFDAIRLERANVFEIGTDSGNMFGVSINRKNWGFTPRKSNVVLENPTSSRPNAAYLQQAYKYYADHFSKLNISNWTLFVVSWHSDKNDPNGLIKKEKDAYKWDLWGLKSLKEFKPPTGSTEKGASYTSIKVRQFNSHGKKYYEKWEATDLDINAEGGVYVTLENRQPEVDEHNLSQFCSLTGETVYGIPSRFAKKGGETVLGPNWVHYNQAVKDAFYEELRQKGNVICKETYRFSPSHVLHSEMLDLLRTMIKNGKLGGKIAKWFILDTNQADKGKLVRLAELASKKDELTTDNSMEQVCRDIVKTFPMLFIYDGVRYGTDHLLGRSSSVVNGTIAKYVMDIENKENAVQKDLEVALKEDADRTRAKSTPKIHFGILKG